LVLEVEQNSRPALIGAHCRQRVGGIEARGLGERDGIIISSHVSADEKTGELDLAGLISPTISKLWKVGWRP
jgi:hypothetical protein